MKTKDRRQEKHELKQMRIAGLRGVCRTEAVLYNMVGLMTLTKTNNIRH